MNIILFTIIGLIFKTAIPMNDLNWVIEPKYDDIIVYGEQSFVAKENEIYKVFDYSEKVLYEFIDKDILGISDHPNEGGELQELINVNYNGNKSKLFSIKNLRFIHEDKYYLLQTDYYDSERRLIRVFDENKEGVMDFDGNLILPPIYKGVIIKDTYSVGFKEEEILIFNTDNELINSLSYPQNGSQYIKDNELFKVQKKIEGEPNVYKEVRNRENGVTRITYEKAGSEKFVSGIVDKQNNIVIPFIYSSIYVQSKDFIVVTKNEKITNNGIPISFHKPKKGAIDFDHIEILPCIYKSIGIIEGGFIQVENFDDKRAIFDLRERKFHTGFVFNNYTEAASKIAELDASKDYIEFKENDLTGLKNKKNEILIPAKYSGISSTYNPQIYIVTGAGEDEFGYEGYYHIGLNKEIVPTIYADRGGIGGHKKNNQDNVITVMDPETSEIGFYNIDGTKISESIYDESVEGFSEDLAPVYIDYSGKTGMIDIDGNVIYDYIFDSMTLPYNGKSIVSYNGKYGILKLK